MSVCHIYLVLFSPLARAALKPLCAGQRATFLNESQTEQELPHTERGAAPVSSSSPRGPPSPPITSPSLGKRAIQFLKAAASAFQGGFSRKKTAHFESKDSKAPSHCNLKVFLFSSFLLNVNSHVSWSPSNSEYPPMYKIGIILSSHPFQTQQITHLCTNIHKLKGQLMVVGTYLLKDESKTDSHSECEVTTA